jgi:uncharacterized membrane protein
MALRNKGGPQRSQIHFVGGNGFRVSLYSHFDLTGGNLDMEWRIIVLNFVYAFLGVVLMFVAYKIFDFLTPQINYAEELKKNNISVAIFIAALFIAIGIIVGGALN